MGTLLHCHYSTIFHSFRRVAGGSGRARWHRAADVFGLWPGAQGVGLDFLRKSSQHGWRKSSSRCLLKGLFFWRCVWWNLVYCNLNFYTVSFGCLNIWNSMDTQNFLYWRLLRGWTILNPFEANPLISLGKGLEMHLAACKQNVPVWKGTTSTHSFQTWSVCLICSVHRFLVRNGIWFMIYWHIFWFNGFIWPGCSTMMVVSCCV